MIVLIHVVIALSSIVMATFGAFKPSKKTMHINYGLIGLTFASGTIVALTYHVGLIKTCSDGLIYLAVVTSGVLVSSKKLAKNNSQ